MKIALVHDFLIKLGGAERVVKEWMDMFPEAKLHVLIYDEEKVGKMFPKERIVVSPLQKRYQRWKKLPLLKNIATRLLLPHIPEAVETWDFSEYDLVLSSNTAWAHGIIVPPQVRHVCYCHSPMRFAWDYTNEYKEAISTKQWIKDLITRSLFPIRFWDQIAGTRPDRYIANSHTVAHRIFKYYGQQAEVIFPPVDVERFAGKRKKGDYFLVVSTLAQYKRIDLVVDLFNKIDRKLVIIGDGPERKSLESRAQDNIVFTGFLPDEEVVQMMKGARAFIFPTEEDFGITAVEAISAGVPVLGFGKGGLKEIVLPGKTGELFHEQNLRSIEDGLARLLSHEEQYDPFFMASFAEQFSKKQYEKKLKKTLSALFS